MSSHPRRPGLEPRALPVRAGALGPAALGTGEGRAAQRESQASDTGASHPPMATPRGAVSEGSQWFREASRQRPLVPADDLARQPPRALSRARLRKHLLPRTSDRPESPPGGFLVYRPPVLFSASLPVATPPISSDSSRSSSFILVSAHTAAPPPHPLLALPRLRAKALRAFSLPSIPGLAWFPRI